MSWPCVSPDAVERIDRWLHSLRKLLMVFTIQLVYVRVQGNVRGCGADTRRRASSPHSLATLCVRVERDSLPHHVVMMQRR
jgi:hypothetical protein